MSGFSSSLDTGIGYFVDKSTPSSQNYTTAELPVGGEEDFTMPTGKVAILLILSVNKPCTIEIHGSEARNDENPYVFKATSENLTDIGRIVFNDGTETFRDRFAMIANTEHPVGTNTYWRVKNTGNTLTSISVNLEYALVME